MMIPELNKPTMFMKHIMALRIWCDYRGPFQFTVLLAYGYLTRYYPYTVLCRLTRTRQIATRIRTRGFG
jgi:hypothetical protein